MADSAKVAVPDLVNMKQADAEAALRAAQLTVGEELVVAVDQGPDAGVVIGTTPPAKAFVSAGSPVSLTISAGAAPAQGAVDAQDADAAPTPPGPTSPAPKPEPAPPDAKKGAQDAGGNGNGNGNGDGGGNGGNGGGGGAPTPSPAPAPGAPVMVPHLVGLTQAAAELSLQHAGLSIGTTTSAPSASVPSGGVAGAMPPAGTVVGAGSTVDLRFSTGPKTSNFAAYGLTTAAVLAIVGIISLVIYRSDGAILEHLSNKDTARGLITFLIVFTTVVIAVILAVSAVLLEGGVNDKRFDNGKQVLTILMGVLGTIVGFYFGASDGKSSNGTDLKSNAVAVTTKSIPAATTGKPYGPVTLAASGGAGTLKWSVNPTLPTGMKLAAGGVIDGTPTASSPQKTYKFTVSDSASPSSSDQASLDLEVDDAKPDASK